MKQEKIKAYILRVNDEGIQYKGYFADIDNTLEAKQRMVDGLIQVIPLTPEIDVILNDEGKLMDLPVNRLWLGENMLPLDMLVGTLICVRHDDDEFVSIKTEDKEIIERLLVPVKSIHEGIRQSIVCLRPKEELIEYTE